MSGYRQMNYMNGHEGHRFQSYGKREAEAEPKADAEAWYQPYGYSNWNMYSNWPMNYNNWTSRSQQLLSDHSCSFPSVSTLKLMMNLQNCIQSLLENTGRHQ